MDIICCYPGYGGLGEPAAHPKGFRSQVVVSSLPPCSLSLLRWGAEAGVVPARSPVPFLSGKMGLLVPIAAQAAPLLFSSFRWCSSLCSDNEQCVQGSQSCSAKEPVKHINIDTNLFSEFVFFIIIIIFFVNSSLLKK